ncbi:hypothetical protein N7495_008782 [Penicillium taxi]|uniref:uncharacterized protein n=1 Tax=Penicillium taxi TaxID=168475 RepID=UPI0025450E5C|nr:uncharacterized protein N7495_008782 [Penicillium taxi]KAJ5888741.1 hypothetical protein N7495_008782 [Penicillium taxi]
MDPTIPAPGSDNSRAQLSSLPASTVERDPSRNDYPFPTASRSGNSPIRGPGRIDASATTSGTRLEPPATDSVASGAGKTSKSKRKKNRQRKRQNRQESFLTPTTQDSHDPQAISSGTGAARELMEGDHPTPKEVPSFFKLGRKLSESSLESDALLDHRDQPMMRPRRDSRPASSYRPSSLVATAFRSNDSRATNTTVFRRTQQYQGDSGGSDTNDRTPLMRHQPGHTPVFSHYGTESRDLPQIPRRASVRTVSSSQCSPNHSIYSERDYDVNNPPSIPGTPKITPDMNYDDAMVTGAEFDFTMARSMETRRDSSNRTNDTVIHMEGAHHSAPSSIRSGQYSPQELRRRRTVALPVEEDVCFPAISDMGDEEPQVARDETNERRRRRHRPWPDLSVLEEWSREEKEDRSGDQRVKQISEPMFIEGRLRPQYKLWRREEEEAPYRFTYFNEELQSTIHAQTISELVRPGGDFRELFIPDPPELEDSSDEEDFEGDNSVAESGAAHWNNTPVSGIRRPASNMDLKSSERDPAQAAIDGNKELLRNLSVTSESKLSSREISPSKPNPTAKPKKYGPRPTFWLDVLSPTDAEMRTIAKAFGIHALTAEDIMMQEAREKVELFRSYYFVNYRTFEQDVNSENYLEPINMYVVVFREGVVSFHFSQTPHSANVRRRIRQLMDYLILSSDWISYALIDDITDVFGPLIQAIEDEVDDIDELIMQMHSSSKEGASVMASFSPGDMLRRVGECRKKVMGLYRLLSNKADVVKGFAKRCNEQWEVAPKSEIGLYLGDIQDHIMTMTGNLTHYETMLSRAHSNYLAQINILMNERQEQTADVLGKLTVLGTIVLPMNIICGMWGMNVKVPGQDIDSLNWFWSITAGLVFFALLSFLIAKRVYNIV